MWTERTKGGLQLIWSLTAVIVWASQDGAILCSPVTAQTAGLWWRNNYGLIWVHLLRPVTAIIAEHRQLSGWWLLLWPSEVLMMICNYYTCLSPVLNRTFTAGASCVKVCIMFLNAPCGEYFSFSRNIEDTRQCLPQAGQGPARARRSQQRRKWGMLPPKILNTEALVSNWGAGKRRSLCLIFRQPRLAASCVFSFSLSHEQEGGRSQQA